jgi:2-dehydro-3-deoxyphosphogluconate aldolase / (4S)-4-hydroxy-2-oxoglutarate aldolase
MPRFTRIQVFTRMAETGIVPVFFHADPEVCKGVLEACYKGGVRVFEFTNRGDFAHETFAELNRYAAAHFPDMMLGAGTIMDAGTAALYIQLGANFIVAPITNPDVARVCHRRKVGWVPGCATLSEISVAEELGAEIVKVFPGNVLKPDFISSLKGPMPWTSAMVTGGVEPTEESLSAWFKAGVTCVGIGSQLFPKNVLDKRDFGYVENITRKAMDIVAQLRRT